jgi:serine phosphatase RsbU (regulator of sigma subunit)
MDAKVLIVSDEEDRSEYLAGYIKGLGYQVLQASDAIEAFAQIQSLSPDVVVAGLDTLGIGGLELLQRLRLASNNVPFVFVSRHATVKDVIEAMRLGAIDFMSDPDHDLDSLAMALGRAMQSHSLARENRIYRRHLEQLISELRANIEILEEDQQAGREVQRSLLPNTPFKTGEYRIEYVISSSLILSGDFVDYFQLNEKLLGFYMADVSGHGAASAFMTVLLRHMSSRVMRGIQRPEDAPEPSPARFFQAINRAILDTNIHKHATLFGGILNTQTHELLYASAAHFPPVLLFDGDNMQLLEGGGLPVGLDPETLWVDHSVKFPPGGRLVICSDGVMDVLEADSLQRKEVLLQEFLGQAGSIRNMALGLGLSLDLEFTDDIALMCITRATST